VNTVMRPSAPSKAGAMKRLAGNPEAQQRAEAARARRRAYGAGSGR
jgi:hypothetical protein